MFKQIITTFAFIILINQINFAGHPMRAYDAPTVGLNTFQVELLSEFAFEPHHTCSDFPVVFTYGLADKIDAAIAIPVTQEYSKGNSLNFGVCDVPIEVKYNFYNEPNTKISAIGGVSVPSLSHSDFSTGKTGYLVGFAFSKQYEDFGFHFSPVFNLNRNELDLRENIYSLHMAAEYTLSERVDLITDFGIQSNENPNSVTHPSYFITGIVYNLNNSIALDIGYQKGLTSPETDNGLLVGLTVVY